MQWHIFLGRPPLPAASPAAVSSLIQHPILITGAGGSIGSALARRLASAGARIILLESSENSLNDLQQDLAGGSANANFYLGGVSDRSLLDEIFSLHRPNLVFHAAAHKHVPLIEQQPLAAMANNIFATETLVASASAHNARIVLVSTDKAAAPAAMMGATKRLAEQIVLTSGGTVLRLGNVLASRGSVTEVFARQIASGLPLTVSDPAARRYFLTIAEAVELLLVAASEPQTHTLLVPLLPGPHFIADLARFMARTLVPDRESAIEFTHLRPGDKESEQLWSESETPHPATAGSLVCLHSPLPPRSQLHSVLATLHRAVQSRDPSAALADLRVLVPDYTPSQTVLAHCSTAASQVSDE
ncbi:MAG TPA: SDR family NAD(P)-dependent oxidoreductase [Terracidiphilus sp.]|nr:SDR family NAD(P)-dependent oxidoreductase [Terracidiphilus sp.]